jgi:hypothetical protein
LSPRALHRLVQQAQNARFFNEWLARPPYSDFHPAFKDVVAKLARWPAPNEYGEIAASVRTSVPLLPRFVPQDRAALERAGGYEQHVASLREVPTRREHWHDFFNMAVWAHFPAVRWALNELHTSAASGRADPRNGRTPEQNMASQLDESGMLVTSSSPSLLEDLRALRYKRVFWERRDELAETTRFWLIGHGTLESLLSPHLGLATKALLFEVQALPNLADADAFRVELDQRASRAIRELGCELRRFDPVPVMGIPGYCDNGFSEFYDDARYFRFQRRGG